ncbi:MAG: hypothetical protein Q7R56_00020 [Nanoarchaeota archaeon]|nr:hypothetical protein [Nanoarchaeota archaeon]
MLTKELTTKILDFIREQPRTIQDLALFLDKNWRTADRYIDQLMQETGMIKTKTFRQGTRGAIKIVHWNSIEHTKGTHYQERLHQRVLKGIKKEDFSPFDIYQFCKEEQRQAYKETNEYNLSADVRFENLIKQATQQILFFSGNISWTEFDDSIYKTLEQLAKKKVKMNIITRVTFIEKEKIKKLLAINERVGWDAISIRHQEQPLRGMIIDEHIISLKEVFKPETYREQELNKKTFIFYLLKDQQWIGWLQKVFWNLWEHSIDAEERLQALESITVPKPYKATKKRTP